MKKFFSNLLLILFSIYPLKLLAQTETDHTNERLLTAWQKMIPRYTKIQFAGGMGLLSAGVGWNYGHNKSWETEVLWGFVPSFSNDRTKLTMTLRENYVPWSVRLGKGWSLQPLSCGIYINTIFDGMDQRTEKIPERLLLVFYQNTHSCTTRPTHFFL